MISADVAASFSIWRLASGVLEESAWADSHDTEETGYFLQTDTERTNRDDCNRAGDPDNLLVLERLYAQTPKPENQSGRFRGLLKSQITRDHLTDLVRSDQSAADLASPPRENLTPSNAIRISPKGKHISLGGMEIVDISLKLQMFGYVVFSNPCLWCKE